MTKKNKAWVKQRKKRIRNSKSNKRSKKPMTKDEYQEQEDLNYD